MNKRIKGILLSAIAACSMLFMAMPAYADPAVSGVSTSVTEVEVGSTETFTVTLTVPGTSKKISDLSMKVKFDKSVFEVTEYTIPNMTGMNKMQSNVSEANSNGFFSATYNSVSSDADVDFSGINLTATFKLKPGAAVGNYEFSIAQDVAVGSLDGSGGPDTLMNYDDFTNKIATITVKLPHVHVYDQTDTGITHLKTAATCTAAAVYYKSCTCGVNGTETFTSGSALGHDYSKKTETDTYLKTAASKCTEHNVYWYACSHCDANAKDDAAATDKYYTGTSTGAHSFTEKIEDDAHYVAGTGTDCSSVKKYYYDCAYCDLKGTATFDSTTFGLHNYATKWSSNADKHWHECSVCHDKKDEEAHTPGAAATETTAQKCTVCDYVIKAALGHTHNLTKVPAKAATCTEAGNVEYYKCSGCSKLFSDAAGKTEVSADKTVVKVISHSYEWVVDKAATETEKGSKHEECKVCGDKKAAVEIPATGTTTPDSPAAGDNGMKGLWIAIIAVTLLGAGGTVIIGKKKNSFAK